MEASRRTGKQPGKLGYLCYRDGRTNVTQTEIVLDPIPQLVARHRKLKGQRDGLDAEIRLLKNELRPAVEAIGGKWTDEKGYAKVVERSDSVGFPGASVDRLATTWSKSDDPIMQSCGEMLLGLRKEKAGFSYLQVK